MIIRSFAPAAAALAAVLLLSGGQARADLCETSPGSQKYTDQNCDKPSTATKPAAQPAPQQPVSQTHGALREELKRRLNAGSAKPAQTDSFADRIADAQTRAKNAIVSGGMASDAKEKAQFQRNYETAMKDLRKAYDDAGAAVPADRRAEIAAMRDQAEAELRGKAQEANLMAAAPAPTRVAAQPAAEPLKDVLTVCEPPEKGVATCFEIPPTGSLCRKVYYQAGEVTWRDSRMSTCSAGDLQQRDAYFAGKPVGTEAPPDPRAAQLDKMMSSLPRQCQDDLRHFLYGARDSANSRRASDEAVNGFRNIARDDACLKGVERIANAIGVQMPRRRLADDDRRAWGAALADKPREEEQIGDIPADTGPNGYSSQEVISSGMELLGGVLSLLGAAASAYSAGSSYYYSAPPTRNYATPPNSGGYVYRAAPPQSQSTITGGSR